MEKVQLGPSTIIYPMPVFLIGADVDGKPDFMVAAWSGIACSEPPMVSVAFQPHRHTLKGVREHRAFSINIPPVSLLEATDYCGITSGKDEPDKALTAGFEVFYGNLAHAPLIRQCPINLECIVVMTLELGSHHLVIGEIQEVHADKEVLGKDGKPDACKIDPLIFTVPDRSYRRLGEVVGKAFKAGNALKQKRD